MAASRPMITVKEADKIIFKDVKVFPAVRVALEGAFGRVLREDLFADRDVPPFDRVMMDGIGVSFDAYKKGCVRFFVEGIQRAGTPSAKLKDANSCLEVMTGAMLPLGCDCVIPYEDIEIKNKIAQLRKKVRLRKGQYIHAKASDQNRGACLASKGVRLGASQIAVAASIGKTDILVSSLPKVAVIGTGDEVVDIHKKLKPYQIRRSNSYMIQAALELSGCAHATRFHLRDDQEEMKTLLIKALEDFDVVVLIGGVSMGKFDYVPQVLAEMGVKALFHQVKQRPGKPFWFGKARQGNPVFALPGNPVSVQVGVYRYVLPYLEAALGAQVSKRERVILSRKVDVKTDRVYFLPVKLQSHKDGRLFGAPVMPRNSGDFSGLSAADGFLQLPGDTFKFSRGFVASFFRWNQRAS